MEFKNVMLITLLLLAVLTIGAASAAEDVDALAADDTGDTLAVDDTGDELTVEAPVGDVVEVDESDDVLEKVTAEDFNATIVGEEFDVDDASATVVRFDWPDELNTYSDVVKVEVNPGSAPPFLKSDGQTSKNVTLSELLIDAPGTYNLTVVYDDVTPLILAKGTIKVTKTYTASNFMEIYDKTVEDANNYVCNVFDTIGSGLNGNVTVYANNSIVYNNEFIGTPQSIRITANNLTGISNGLYTVKVVYKRATDGKEYSNEAKINFAIQSNVPPVNENLIIGFYTDVFSPDDVICYVYDSSQAGLDGTLTVYANNTKVFSKKIITGFDEEASVTPRNLSGIYNGDYLIKVVYVDANDVTYSDNRTVYFDNVCGNPLSTTISASAMTVVFNENKNLVATLKDSNGKAVANENVWISIMGIEYQLKTDKNGKIKQSVGTLPPKKHTITFTFDGNTFYKKSTKKVTVTVNKATPKLTAAKKTFKKSVKTKKYTVTLKSNVNKAIKNAKVKLTVNKKTYTVKTNAKGQATFKITNLKKKGTFKATVKFAGDSYYNAKTVKPKIVVK